MNSINHQMYSVEFSPSELEQLLKVLYEQTVLRDEAAIRLIAKINVDVHTQSLLNLNEQKFISDYDYDFDTKMMTATETYHRYRSDRLEDLPNPIDNPEESSGVLRKIAESLDAITEHLNQEHSEALGFVPCYQQLVVYRDDQIGRYWYQVNAQRQMIPIAARVLNCRLQSIDLVREKSGESKIDLSVQADKLYRLNIPCKSVFGKTLILGLASLSPIQLRSPITIEPVRSSSRQFVTCKLYQRGVVLRYTPPSAVHWPTVIRELQQKLEQLKTGEFSREKADVIDEMDV